MGQTLFAWPPRFAFPEAKPFRHPEWSQLTFVTRYESFLQAQAVREARAAPWDERVRTGTSIPLRRLADGRWQIESALDADRIEPGPFPGWLLVRADAAGERAQMGHDDYANRNRAFSQPNRGRWVAAVKPSRSVKSAVTSRRSPVSRSSRGFEARRATTTGGKSCPMR